MLEQQLHLQEDDLLQIRKRHAGERKRRATVLHLSCCRRCRLALTKAEALLGALAPRTVDNSVLRNRDVLAESRTLAPIPEGIYMAVLRKLVNKLRKLEN